MSKLPDSGQRTTFSAGGQKETAGKASGFHLLPRAGIERLAQRYADGAAKYSPRNWERGIPKEECINAAFRHLLQLAEGDQSEDHAAAVAWWMMAVMHFEKGSENRASEEDELIHCTSYSEDPIAI
jgi:hypothetical protein